MTNEAVGNILNSFGINLSNEDKLELSLIDNDHFSNNSKSFFESNESLVFYLIDSWAKHVKFSKNFCGLCENQIHYENWSIAAIKYMLSKAKRLYGCRYNHIIKKALSLTYKDHERYPIKLIGDSNYSGKHFLSKFGVVLYLIQRDNRYWWGREGHREYAYKDDIIDYHYKITHNALAIFNSINLNDDPEVISNNLVDRLSAYQELVFLETLNYEYTFDCKTPDYTIVSYLTYGSSETPIEVICHQCNRCHTIINYDAKCDCVRGCNKCGLCERKSDDCDFLYYDD